MSKANFAPSGKGRGITAAAGGALPPESGRVRFVAGVRALRSAWLQVVGMPDYEAYLEHMRRRHPGAPVLTRGEFCALSIERKYGARGPRCC